MKQIFNGVQRARVALGFLNNLTGQNIKSFISLFSEEQLKSLSLSKEEIEEDLQFLYNEHTDISLDLLNAYKMVEEFGAGLNCTICEAANHHNFKNKESRDNFKMIFDFNYCYNLFNSPGIISTLEFLKQMKQLNNFTRLLGLLYGLNIKNASENNYEKIEKVDQMRLSCLASVDDFSDDEQCAEMCIEIGRPNQFFMSRMIPSLSSFIVMVSDFYGSQSLLKKEETNPSPEHTTETTEEAIQVIVDEWNVDYFLPPSHPREFLDLNAMKVDLAYESGWNFYEIRMKDWKAFTGSEGVFKVMILVGLMINLLM